MKEPKYNPCDIVDVLLKGEQRRGVFLKYVFPDADDVDPLVEVVITDGCKLQTMTDWRANPLVPMGRNCCDESLLTLVQPCWVPVTE